MSALNASRTKSAVEKETMRVDGEKTVGMGAHHLRSLMRAFCADLDQRWERDVTGFFKRQ